MSMYTQGVDQTCSVLFGVAVGLVFFGVLICLQGRASQLSRLKLGMLAVLALIIAPAAGVLCLFPLSIHIQLGKPELLSLQF